MLYSWGRVRVGLGLGLGPGLAGLSTHVPRERERVAMDPHRHFAPHHPLHMRAMAGNHRDPFGRIIPNSLSSLSTGQPFYTVESLEGATSLPLLPKHPLSPADRESLPQNRARVGFAGRSSFPETRVLCAQHLHNLHSLDRIQNLRYFDYANEHRPASIENRQKLETLARI